MPFILLVIYFIHANLFSLRIQLDGEMVKKVDEINEKFNENSPKYQLCIDLLDEGYTLNVIEDSNISSKLNSVCESFGGRLKFFKLGTKPEGILIDL